MNMNVVFFKLEVQKEIWTEFKETITKNHTIQEILIELIESRIKKFKDKNDKQK